MQEIGRQERESNVRQDPVELGLPVGGLVRVTVGLAPLDDGLEDDLLVAVRQLEVVVRDEVDQLSLADRNELVAVDNLILLITVKTFSSGSHGDSS